MKNFKLIFCVVFIVTYNCQDKSTHKRIITDDLEGIKGSEKYNESSYITAGNRVYAIGSQNGGFPEIGWHIKGEMGGVWNHPIKLLDGFDVNINTDNDSAKLINAEFINYPTANKFVYKLNKFGLTVDQIQFVPDDTEGMVVTYQITNNSTKDFIGTLDYTAHVDLRPTWLGEEANMIDAVDELTFNSTNNQIIAKDSKNDWFCLTAASETPSEHQIIASNYSGKGKSGKLFFDLFINTNTSKEITFYIAGSYTSKDAAKETLKTLKNNRSLKFKEKNERFKKIERSSKLTTSDSSFNKVYRWIKYNSDWFIREVPEHGKGIAAGFPDYPWWFGCDSEYALKGYLTIGNFDLVKSNIKLLVNLSEKSNENGRIIHEASTNGIVYNKGNVNETPQFISLLWDTYLWTGDKQLLASKFDLVKNGVDWLINEKDLNKNGFPEGTGMMEIHGLDSEMIDVAAYTQKGFKDASEIAKVLEKNDLADIYAKYAKTLKQKINTHFWVEDYNSYGDFIANDSQTLHLIEDAVIRADTLKKPWAVRELLETKKYILKNPSERNRPFVLHHNWVVNTPLEMKIADSAMAQKALKTARKFVNPFGVFVTGIDRDESANKEFGSFKGSKSFSYTGAVMTLPTGVLAVSENNYGNPNEALNYLKRMGESFSYALPGSIYEVSPDYGMFAQAWNIYSYGVPVTQQFFGIQPHAFDKTVIIQPLMPDVWDFANLENIKIGNNEISIYYTKKENGYSIKLISKLNGWDIKILPTEGYKLAKTIVAKSKHTELVFSKK